MKPYFALLILNLLFFPGFGQIVKLDINNPVPRIGEDISVNYTIRMTNQKVTFPISPDKLKEIKVNDIGTGSLTLQDYASDTGRVIIGPLTFVIDGKMFKSDSLVLNIYPKLPDAANGFWTRFIKYRGEYYLITEQRISGEWKYKKDSKHSSSMSFDQEGIKFAEITESTINFDDLKFSFKYSTSSSQVIDKEDILGSGTVHYKLYVYRIEAAQNYKNDFVLKKKFFDNFPKYTDYEPIKIVIN